MAKMFYTLDEAAQKLGKSTGEVMEMAKSGQIQEFRDREKLMFKVDQIDMLAGSDDDGPGMGDSNIELIGLADSGEHDTVEIKEESVLGEEVKGGSGSVLGLADSRESSGISIFDADETETADPSAATQVSDAMSPMEFSLDSGSSGSGLLDLTREADDTSLGADLLDEIYQAGAEESGEAAGTGLFEAAPVGGPDAASAGLVMPVAVASYDGAGSGMGVGFAIGGTAALLLSMTVLMSAANGTVPGLANMIADNYMIAMGGLAGLTLIFGIIGYFIGRSSG